MLTNPTKTEKVSHRLLFKIILVVLAVLIFLTLARIVYYFIYLEIDRNSNNVLDNSTDKVSTKAINLHKSLTIIDLHADSLLAMRDLNKKGTYGQVDIPRLIEGNVAIQCFGVVTKFPINPTPFGFDGKADIDLKVIISHFWPLKTLWSIKERAIYLTRRLHLISKKSNGGFYIIETATELDNYLKAHQKRLNITAGILDIEGAQCLEGNIHNIDDLYHVGVRIIGPVHFCDNELGGSGFGIKKDGLTTFGKKAIQRMEKLKITIDLAHSSPKMINDILNIAKRPVIVSHTGVKGINDSIRNLSDVEVIRIAKNGGLIGIGFWQVATGGNDAKAIARSIRYVSNLVGVQYVGLGSDYDGSIVAPFDSGHLVKLTQALIDEGFSDEEIRLIMGENALKFLLTNLPKN